MSMTRYIHPVFAHAGDAEASSLVISTESLGGRRSDMKLTGPLPADWSVNLSRDFAARGVSLQNGYARRIDSDQWTVQLEVEQSLADSAGPEGLVRAIYSKVRPPVVEPALLDCELRESKSFGGCLELEVDAWDAVGLLAAVLGCAASAGLLAVEMILETQDDCAFHHLGLKDRGDAVPSLRQRRALDRGLKRLGKI